MAVFMKQGGQWLYDHSTLDIVGVKDPDGSEFFFARTSRFGSFFDTTNQNGTANTARTMTFDNSDAANTGVSMASNSKFSVNRDGVYNFQFSAQFVNEDTKGNDASVWFAKGTTGASTAIPNSGTLISIASTHGGIPGHTIAAWNIYIPMVVGEYVELYWSKTSIDVSLLAIGTQTSPTRPAAPSIILTINEVT
jgi:hypothetical protein